VETLLKFTCRPYDGLNVSTVCSPADIEMVQIWQMWVEWLTTVVVILSCRCLRLWISLV